MNRRFVRRKSIIFKLNSFFFCSLFWLNVMCCCLFRMTIYYCCQWHRHCHCYTDRSHWLTWNAVEQFWFTIRRTKVCSFDSFYWTLITEHRTLTNGFTALELQNSFQLTQSSNITMHMLILVLRFPRFNMFLLMVRLLWNKVPLPYRLFKNTIISNEQNKEKIWILCQFWIWCFSNSRSYVIRFSSPHLIIFAFLWYIFFPANCISPPDNSQFATSMLSLHRQHCINSI